VGRGIMGVKRKRKKGPCVGNGEKQGRERK